MLYPPSQQWLIKCFYFCVCLLTNGWPLAKTNTFKTMDFKVLLLALYVPNVAQRSIWEQCKKKYILRTDRPTNDPTFGEISSGHISATTARGRPTPFHFMFGSTVGFSGSSDRIALFRVGPNPIGMWEKIMREE